MIQYIFTTVYVFVGHRFVLPELLMTMSMSGIFDHKKEKKDYLLIFMETEEYRTNDWYTYIWCELE